MTLEELLEQVLERVRNSPGDLKKTVSSRLTGGAPTIQDAARELIRSVIEPAPPTPKQSITASERPTQTGEQTALPLSVPDSPGLSHGELAASLGGIPLGTVRTWGQKGKTPAAYNGRPVRPYRYDPALKRWFPSAP